MLRYLFLAALMCVLVQQYCYAGGKEELAADRIDPKLLRDAHAVKRFCEMTINISSPECIDIEQHYAITVLDKQGDEYARCVVGFSKLEKVEKVYGYLYDKKGSLLNKIRESDFFIHGISLAPAAYDDDRVMEHQETYRQYPYTVEYFVHTRQVHSFILPFWIVRDDNDCSVEKGSMTLTTPKEFRIRYHSINGQYEPVKTEEKDKVIYTWKIGNVAAEKKEYLSKEAFRGSPGVLLAPVDCKLANYAGSMKDWSSMGTFLYQLNKDRDVLSEEKKRKVHELTAEAKDSREKINILYNYLQGSTRYVSIQYGIGGWQTIDALTTCNNQYGDCKGLSNYMMALLKEAGIPSYAVIIYAGREAALQMIRDFPAQMFNHVILAVPLDDDTIWLECTSRDLPAGYLGSFTSDRDALMVTPEGGVVVHTPAYDSSLNTVTHRVKGICNEDGSISFSMQNSYTGVNAEPLLAMSYMNDQQKDQRINNEFELSSYLVAGYKLERNDRSGLLGMEERMQIQANNMVTKAGSYKLVSVNMAPEKLPVEAQTEDRKKRFVLANAYTSRDTFELTLPAASSVSGLPDPVTSESPFGRFTLSVRQEADKVIVLKTLIRRSGNFAPQQFPDYEAWIDNINNDNHYKVVLKNK